MDQLLKNGKVRRGQLGIVVQKISSDMAASLGLSDTRGVIVSSVTQGSAAERAGLKRGDVITAIDGTPVTDTNSFRNRVASTLPGTQVTLTVLRDNREQQLRATLGEFVPEAAKADEEGAGDGSTGKATGKLGLGVQPVTPELAKQLRLPAGVQGLAVMQVDPTGPAAEAGIGEGDVIEEVNRQPVHTVAELQVALARTGTRPALLLVNHEGNEIFLTVRPRQ